MQCDKMQMCLKLLDELLPAAAEESGTSLSGISRLYNYDKVAAESAQVPGSRLISMTNF